jgi:hypothetical protein
MGNEGYSSVNHHRVCTSATDAKTAADVTSSGERARTHILTPSDIAKEASSC